MESPPRLGLGNTYTRPLRGKTDLPTRVWVQSLGMGMGRCQAPNPTRPVGRLPLIVSYILISLKAYSTLHSILSHTYYHSSSNQHGIYPTLIHSIKPYHSSSNIYPRAISTSQGSSINKAFNQAYSIIQTQHHGIH